MPPKFYKHKLLLDEGLFSRKLLKRINSRHNIRHIKDDLDMGGVTDAQVYEVAKRQRRIIVTYNVKDFRQLATQSTETGVIGVTQALTPEQLDTRLNALLSKKSERSLYGEYTPLSSDQ